MPEAKITGTIDQIFDPVTRGNYTSRKLWLITDETYPQTLEVECGGKKADLFNNLSAGQSAAFYVNINGRKWQPEGKEPKVFLSLPCWKVDVHGNQVENHSIAAPDNHDDSKDDLPF